MSEKEYAAQLLDSIPAENLGYVIACLQRIRAVDEEFFERLNDPASEEKADIPNAITLSAIREIEQMKEHPEAYKSYTDVDEMMEDLYVDDPV